MSELKITCLIDNKAENGLAAEHGLSLLAEYGGRTYLLDSGSSGKFADNAKKLGIDLSTVDIAVLSHGTMTTAAASVPSLPRTQTRRSTPARASATAAFSSSARSDTPSACPRACLKRAGSASSP